MVRIASYNVENLFARPKAFNRNDWAKGLPILNAYHDVNELFLNATYSAADKRRIRDLLDIYSINDSGAIRRKRTQYPRWAWLRKYRGKFDRQPRDTTQDVQIIANGRDDWIGRVELAAEPADEGIVFSRDCPQYELRIPSNLSMDGKNSVFRIFRQVQRSNKGLVV